MRSETKCVKKRVIYEFNVLFQQTHFLTFKHFAKRRGHFVIPQLFRHYQRLNRIDECARPDTIFIAVGQIDNDVMIIEILIEQDAHPHLGATVVANLVPAA